MKQGLAASAVIFVAAYLLFASRVTASPRIAATFSIVAYDPTKKDVGVAVASKYFAVGADVPWVDPELGAIATQALVNVSLGPQGLELLRQGRTAAQAAAQMLASDLGREDRQLGIVDVHGNAYTYSGTRTIKVVGGRTGKDRDGRVYAIQGNILANDTVITSMEKAFLATSGDLSEKLMSALIAGESSGGDSRGKQSAAIIVKRSKSKAGPDSYQVDLRVDDHTEPVRELARLFAIANGRNQILKAFSMIESKQQAQEADAIVRRALGAAPASGDLLFAAAAYFMAKGDRPEALSHLEKLIALDPRSKSLLVLPQAGFHELWNEPRFQRIMKEVGR